MFEFIMFVIFLILFAITIAIDADFINITNNIIIIIVNSACIILGIYEICYDFWLFPIKPTDVLAIIVSFILFMDYSEHINFKFRNVIIDRKSTRLNSSHTDLIIKRTVYLLAVIIYILFIKENIVMLLN